MAISVCFHFTLFVAALYISYQGKTLYFELCRKKELIYQMQMRNVQQFNVKRLYTLPFDANWIGKWKILIHILYLSLPKKRVLLFQPPNPPRQFRRPWKQHFNLLCISCKLPYPAVTSCITHETFATECDQILIVSSIANTSSGELKREVLIHA